MSRSTRRREGDHQVELFLQRVCAACRVWVHAARLASVVAAVTALFRANSLAFAALGRAMPGRSRAGIKRIDRLLSNAKLHRELPVIYRAIAGQLLTGVDRPLLLLDWSKVTEGFYTLACTVAFDGRSIPLYSEVHPEKKLSNRRVGYRFLETLREIVPPGCVPILCFDAGFGSHFYTFVTDQLGWDFVSRTRGNRSIRRSETEEWIAGTDLYEQATTKPRDLGLWWVCRSGATALLRLVTIKSPRAKGRKKHPRRKVPRSGAERSARTCAKEPWVLFTSLRDMDAAVIVSIYRKRMQIEETFRDWKNPRFGWCLRHVRSRSADRLAVVLVIAALGMLVALLIGRAAERRGIHRSYQGNSITHRRVLSFFFLGALVLTEDSLEWLPPGALFDECDSIRESILKTVPDVV